ncbi:MAG TPA: APC family permease [Acidimicrobiia bacterium]|nr:APC family permease [Acidimicrobiia bacterium]
MTSQQKQAGGPGLPGPVPLRPARPDTLARIRRVIVGRPLATERIVHEKLGKPTALAVFASDNLSSSAYATEEILRVLLFAGLGTAAFSRVVPITVALLVVLGILLFSYRQTIRAYPQAGGAYLVTRDNFGLLPAQLAGVALLTDYILTVSVSVAAGTAALTSIYEGLHSWRVPISLGFVAIIAWGNLRGVRESGRLFALPTYFFLAMMAILLGVSFFRLAVGSLPESASPFPLPDTRSFAGVALVFLILRAFASGGAAVTGVEAISNGVPAFRPPEWKNAIKTLMWMGTLLGTMFLGLSILAARMHIVPDPLEKITVNAQIAKAVFGASTAGTALFVMVQIATMLILVLAANTSYADFPRLASFHAGDRFLPRQLTRYGDRLVFSNGVLFLSIFAGLVLVVFDASVTRLIPLYAIGVFMSFTFSQAGMAKRHWTRREPNWRTGLAINGFGAIVSATMTVIIAATKFAQGAYIILIAIPVALYALLNINRHYKETAKALRDPDRRPPAGEPPRQRVVIPVGVPGPDDVYAVAYAERVSPLEARLVHFADSTETVYDRPDGGGHLGYPIEVLPKVNDIPTEIRNLVREIRAETEQEDLINVIVPETVRHPGWRHVLHKLHVQRIKLALVAEADVVVTNVAHHAGYEELEPVNGVDARGVMEGWRHVAVVLVAGVHNATGWSLRYARSLRADEMHCVHVSVEDKKAEKVRREWDELNIEQPLEILESPYRHIAGPIHSFVRDILEERPKTFVTIVIAEFVVQRWWHRFLHNQTALALKATFLFEPSVVVAAVPYAL